MVRLFSSNRAFNPECDFSLLQSGVGCIFVIMYVKFVVAVFLVALASLCFAEVVRFNRCYVPKNQKANCTVHEVRIVPCAEAAENTPCKLKAGEAASISFDFTPDFTAQAPQSQAYKLDAIIDKPYVDMDTNACNFMTCPLQAGVRQTYTYSLNISSSYPLGTHSLKWLLWNENDHHQSCCFKTSIKLLN